MQPNTSKVEVKANAQTLRHSAQTRYCGMHILCSLYGPLLFNLLLSVSVCAELQSFGGISSRFSNPAQIQPSCQMDGCVQSLI